tara:strand:+ start:7069 stop:7398 length:330 start_codon:yes stop_codon:yes gene_type:complete
MPRSKGEELFASQVKEFDFPLPKEEYKFLDYRRFRFDFAWPEEFIAVEIEGGTWNAGRHSRGAGFQKDCEKYNIATREGWKVYRFTTDMVKSREGIKFLLGAWPVSRRR